jgi:hemolysin D
MNAPVRFPRRETPQPRREQAAPMREATAARSLETGKPQRRHRADAIFLPAALEILESPPSPVGIALLWVIVLLAAGALAWAYFGRIDIIATAQGKIQPTGRVKVIQPVEAGRIAELQVQDGQHVEKGQVLAVLASDTADADVQEMNAGYMASMAEVARRRAARVIVASREINPAPTIDWPADIPDFIKTREANVLSSDLAQLEADVASLKAQRDQKSRERERYGSSAAAIRTLVGTLQERVNARAVLSSNGSGSKADLINALESLQTQQAALATSVGQMAESEAAVEVATSSIESSYRSFANTNEQKLAEAERLVDQLRQRLTKARMHQRSLTLISPIEGTVSALSISAVGQVVTAGEEIMRVVPQDHGLEIVTYIPNRDVGFVRPGQEAMVRIESLPFTRYGTITAHLTHLAGDAIPAPDASQQEGNPALSPKDHGFAGGERVQNLVFAATLKPDMTYLIADGVEIPLSSGMAVTVEIKTGSRRILEYLFSPLVEVAAKALKER